MSLVPEDPAGGYLASSRRLRAAVEQQAMARQYREKVETELRDICNDVLALLDKS